MGDEVLSSQNKKFVGFQTNETKAIICYLQPTHIYTLTHLYATGVCCLNNHFLQGDWCYERNQFNQSTQLDCLVHLRYLQTKGGRGRERERE